MTYYKNLKVGDKVRVQGHAIDSSEGTVIKVTSSRVTVACFAAAEYVFSTEHGRGWGNNYYLLDMSKADNIERVQQELVKQQANDMCSQINTFISKARQNKWCSDDKFAVISRMYALLEEYEGKVAQTLTEIS